MLASYGLLNSNYALGLEEKMLSLIPKAVEAMGSDNPEIY